MHDVAWMNRKGLNEASWYKNPQRSTNLDSLVSNQLNRALTSFGFASLLLLSACGGGGGGAAGSVAAAGSAAGAGSAATGATAGGSTTGTTTGTTSGSTTASGSSTSNTGSSSTSTSTSTSGATAGSSSSSAGSTSAGSYAAALTLASTSPSVGGQDGATLTLTNSGSSNATANLNVVLPSGFSASGFNADCGATLSSSSNQVTLTNATVPASGKCVFTFTINIPPVNQLPASNTITIGSNNAPNSGALASVAVPSISILGRTPGLYSDTWFPSGVNGVAVLDMFVTPMNDPGPNSNVFWSNQMGGLGGYTGLQSTEIVAGAEGVGKQFLFSLWGATNAQAGTPASAGIGGGSFCTVSGTATDGSAGVQCRYHYDWQAGHTYRFRVTPNASLGGGWFKTNVTDVTGGNVGDSFDIGSIFVGGTATLVPTTYISQWVEYFDWNSKRTDCTSVPYTSVQFSIQAQSASGSPVNLGAANVYANSSCPSSFATTGFNTSNKTSTEIGAPQASAQGLVKANGSCLTAQQGETAGNPVGSNNAILSSCPTSASVHASGGSKFAPQLWVMASDSTIQIENSYCLTAWNGSNNTTAGSAGSNVVMLTCAAGSPNQQWTVAPGTAGSAGSQVVLTSSGQCLTPNGSSLTLAVCSAANSVWAVPGKSFSY